MGTQRSPAPSSVMRLADELRAELDAARRAERIAAHEAERHRRLARALDRLTCAAFGNVTADGYLHQALEVLLDAAGLSFGVIRVREGQRLWSRVAIGLEEEVAADFVIRLADAGLAPTHESAGEGEGLVALVPPDAACRSRVMRERGVEALYAVALADGDELFGAAYLGAPDDHELTDVQRELLCALAPRVAAAALHMSVHESLQQAVRARDDVLGIVAHDLRNPMNIISIAAHGLLQRLRDVSARNAVNRIVRAVQRAERLIRDLLDLNAIEDGRFTIDPRPIETADLILAGLESQQSLAANAAVIIAADLSPELPPVEADEERMLEVFENLIGNAVKFTSAAGTVTVGAEAQGHEVLFWVKDSGAGIPREQLPRLFDRFYQAHHDDRRGVGLGLTICKAIVEAHGGKIWAESDVGVGTTVYFTLKAAGPSGSAKRAQADVANILLVDDRPENLLSLESILARPDYRLTKASSGEEALRLALKERFAVALIDVAMPGMNGLEVAVHLKELERSRDIPIIFVTAYGNDPEEIHRAYAAGGVDYLVKPLDPEIVRKKVAVFVDLSRRRHNAAAAHPLRN